MSANTNFKLRAASFCLALVAHQNSAAGIPDDRAIVDLVKVSDSIVHGQIISAHGECEVDGICGIMKYKIKARDLKNNEKNVENNDRYAELEFCATEPLTIGNSYYLFLSKPNAAYNSGVADISKQAIEKTHCKLMANHDGIFQVMGGDDDIYRVWSKESFITIDFEDKMLRTNRTYFTFGYRYLKFREELRPLLNGL